MIFKLTVGLITIILALNGLLFQTKKDANGTSSWSNLNTTGRILLILILSLGILNIAKGLYDDQTNALETAKLKKANERLMKVVSVSSGYNALIRGVVSFSRPVSEDRFRDAAKNLFLKYVSVDLYAENKEGRYEGKVDFGTHPELWKFRNLSQISDGAILSKYRDVLSGVPKNQIFFYEIRCSNLKILSQEKIQYTKLDDTDDLKVIVQERLGYIDFGQVYNVKSIYIDEVQIEELGNYKIGELLSF